MHATQDTRELKNYYLFCAVAAGFALFVENGENQASNYEGNPRISILATFDVFLTKKYGCLPSIV